MITGFCRIMITGNRVWVSKCFDSTFTEIFEKLFHSVAFTWSQVDRGGQNLANDTFASL